MLKLEFMANALWIYSKCDFLIIFKTNATQTHQHTYTFRIILIDIQSLCHFGINGNANQLPM